MQRKIVTTDPRYRISDHFFYYELTRSDVAMRNGIDNNVYDMEIIDNARALAENVLEPIRKEFGRFTPNSWYRGELLERVLCDNAYRAWCKKLGKPVTDATWAEYFARKQHPRGESADIEIAGVWNDTLFKWVQKNLEFDQLIREFAKPGDPHSGWVHVSYSRKKNRKQVLHIG